MIPAAFDRYRQIWAIDTEFQVRPGERPFPLCLCGRELRSGQAVCLWRDELEARFFAPIGGGNDVLVMAFVASAEMAVYRVLGWNRHLICWISG